MSFKFIETEKDVFFEELERILGFVITTFAQYRIDSNVVLETYDFRDEEKYSNFFLHFAKSENKVWKLKTEKEWDFGKFPFRESADFLKGILYILKTGGAYDEEDGAPYEEEKALSIVSKYEGKFKGESNSLYIFDMILRDFRGVDVSSGYAIPNEIVNLRHISSWFHLVAWDDLIFVVNPTTNILYVMAYTDKD